MCHPQRQTSLSMKRRGCLKSISLQERREIIVIRARVESMEHGAVRQLAAGQLQPSGRKGMLSPTNRWMKLFHEQNESMFTLNPGKANSSRHNESKTMKADEDGCTLMLYLFKYTKIRIGPTSRWMTLASKLLVAKSFCPEYYKLWANINRENIPLQHQPFLLIFAGELFLIITPMMVHYDACLFLFVYCPWFLIKLMQTFPSRSISNA